LRGNFIRRLYQRKILYSIHRILDSNFIVLEEQTDAAGIFSLQNRRNEECRKGEGKEEMKNARETKNDSNIGDEDKIKQTL
jgi:hypothetical protein